MPPKFPKIIYFWETWGAEKTFDHKILKQTNPSTVPPGFDGIKYFWGAFGECIGHSENVLGIFGGMYWGSDNFLGVGECIGGVIFLFGYSKRCERGGVM